jgi:hypothetical protein
MPHIYFTLQRCLPVSARCAPPRDDVGETKTFQMPKAVTEIRSLARSHTRKALNVLVAVMRHPNATPAARVAAANAILDRGWGKATQPLEGSNDGALELIHRIERVIVHPENSDGKSF